MAKATSNEDLLPPGASFGDGPAGEDGPIRIVFDDAEAKSEGMSFDALPSGKYHVAIADGKLEHAGPNSKNPGKPMYNLQLKVQEGAYENRVVFARIMLWSGAGYSLSQLLKALGFETPAGQEITIPPISDLVGKELIVFVQKKRDDYAMDPDRGYDPKQGTLYKNDVKSYFALESGVGAQSTGGSILP